MKATSEKRKAKNAVAMQEVIDTLELVEVQREFDLHDLAGKKLQWFRKSQKNEKLTRLNKPEATIAAAFADVREIEAFIKSLRANIEAQSNMPK